MRTVIGTVLGLLSVWKVGAFWTGWGAVLLILGVFIWRWLRWRYEERKKWGERFENVYLVVEWEGVREKLEREHGDIVRFIEWVEEGKVKEGMREVIGKLQEAENRWFMEEEREEFKLRVIPIYKRSGEWVNESWEEYVERVVSYVREDRRVKHYNIKEYDPGYYERYYHREKV